MRKVARDAVHAPKSLLPGEAGPKELLAAVEHRGKPQPKKAFEYKAYKRADVRLALEQLFHGKCAYCETSYSATAPVDIEHYRPKGAVAEDPAHGGYWWVAMDWDNLLPSCIDCNRKRGQRIFEVSTNLEELARTSKPVSGQAGKKDSFPLAGSGARAVYNAMDFSDEHALLLNPCRDDPASSLAYSFDPKYPAGLILPAGDQPHAERGAVSIQVYGLNRQKLVEDRTRLLRRLEYLGDMVIDLASSIQELEDPAVAATLAGTPAAGVAARLRLLRDRTLAEIKATTADDAPYSSMARAWFGRFKTQFLTA
ncbi:HNH endonuclease [Sphingomonas sanguinis]|uniref:Endonuclease n=1 Tax=Sphingomonas sanguinis TaxID=33051 RepID=A0A147HRU9_9SPHN|nr:HNH endonuclease [Sphingomonas sanguinis]KTT65393.1 hypothetical protein NS319_18105 [Sphingomonas sanguinis]